MARLDCQGCDKENDSKHDCRFLYGDLVGYLFQYNASSVVDEEPSVGFVVCARLESDESLFWRFLFVGLEGGLENAEFAAQPSVA